VLVALGRINTELKKDALSGIGQRVAGSAMTLADPEQRNRIA
jgi:hypothetical protein